MHIGLIVMSCYSVTDIWLVTNLFDVNQLPFKFFEIQHIKTLVCYHRSPHKWFKIHYTEKLTVKYLSEIFGFYSIPPIWPPNELKFVHNLKGNYIKAFRSLWFTSKCAHIVQSMSRKSNIFITTDWLTKMLYVSCICVSKSKDLVYAWLISKSTDCKLNWVCHIQSFIFNEALQYIDQMLQ